MLISTLQASTPVVLIVVIILALKAFMAYFQLALLDVTLAELKLMKDDVVPILQALAQQANPLGGGPGAGIVNVEIDG